MIPGRSADVPASLVCMGPIGLDLKHRDLVAASLDGDKEPPVRGDLQCGLHVTVAW